jgi:diguanylate cyclase (GGDEF)-like protein/PAS domain S-box-containing protein
LLFEQLPTALMATTIVGALVAYVFWDQVAHHWLINWLVAMSLISVCRVWLRHAYFKARPDVRDAMRWGRRFIAGVMLSGTVWGIAGVFPLPHDAVLQQMFVAFVLAGLAAGGLATLSSYRGAYAAFLVPAILPFAVKVMTLEGEVHMAMSTMMFLFIGMMSIISARYYRSVSSSLRLRYDKAHLLEDLAAARDRQEAVNLALHAQVDERKRTEAALQRAYDELERKVQERTVQLKQANDVLRTEKELFRVTLASIGDAVITTDAHGRITSLNTVAETLTGWSDLELKGRVLTQVLSILDEDTREPIDDPVARALRGETAGGAGNRWLLVRHDGRTLHIDMSFAPIRDSDELRIGAVLVFRDVTAERKLAQELSHQATHDLLTGLVNRHEFERRLTHLLASASSYTPHALLYLDLDQFKVVNDTCGHAAGDDLLRQLSALLRTKLRTGDTLARLGGDEFGVLLEHCSIAEARRIADTLRELVQSFRFGWQEKTFNIGVSIGLVPLSQTGETLAGVFSAADSACYAAKERGRNRVHLYKADDTMLRRRDGEMRWMPRIQQAMAESRLRLYYQPIVPLAPKPGQQPHGEVLLRMVDESGRLVLPGAFIPAAERYGMMLDLDRWVVENSLRALARGRGVDPDVNFAINISGQSLGAADFLDFVIEKIETAGVAPSRLCFEITETSAISELAHAMHFIDTLKTLGCRFALDDFGTGLSSFGYLKSLPVDYVKIDGSFVRGLAADAVDRAMVEAVNSIGHIMGLKTIAEWVQEGALLARLRDIGVDYGQGFALGEPRPLEL